MGAWFRWIKTIYGKMGRVGTVDYTGIKVTRPSTAVPAGFSDGTSIFSRLFAITGGPVQIHKLVGVVTVALVDTGDHRMRKLCTDYARSGDSDLGACTQGSNKPVGTLLGPGGQVTDQYGKLGGLGGVGILQPGSIYWTCRAESPAGSVKWMAWYTPLVEGARLVAAEGDYLDNAEVEEDGSAI